MFPKESLSNHKDAAAGHVGGSQDAANRMIASECQRAADGVNWPAIMAGVVIFAALAALALGVK